MRRYLLVPMLALALVLGACGGNTPSGPRTVTQIVTATGSSAAPTETAGSGGITVVGPSGSTTDGGTTGATGSSGTGTGGESSGPATTSSTAGDTGSNTKASTPATTTPTKPTKTGPKVVNVDPLHVGCALLLDNNDIRDALGKRVSSASLRIVDVPNPKVKMTGKVKCYYGGKSLKKSLPVTVALAQYKSASAAQHQLGVTVDSEISLGAKASTVTVSKRKANVLLRAGGLLIMRYDTWTLSIALEDKLVPASKMPKGLQKLATMVLARVLKNG